MMVSQIEFLALREQWLLNETPLTTLQIPTLLVGFDERYLLQLDAIGMIRKDHVSQHKYRVKGGTVIFCDEVLLKTGVRQ